MRMRVRAVDPYLYPSRNSPTRMSESVLVSITFFISSLPFCLLSSSSFSLFPLLYFSFLFFLFFFLCLFVSFFSFLALFNCPFFFLSFFPFFFLILSFCFVCASFLPPVFFLFFFFSFLSHHVLFFSGLCRQRRVTNNFGIKNKL